MLRRHQSTVFSDHVMLVWLSILMTSQYSGVLKICSNKPLRLTHSAVCMHCAACLCTYVELCEREANMRIIPWLSGRPLKREEKYHTVPSLQCHTDMMTENPPLGPACCMDRALLSRWENFKKSMPKKKNQISRKKIDIFKFFLKR